MVSPLINITSRAWGTKTTLLIGVLLQTTALIGASFATQIWHLFLSVGLCFGWGLGFLYVGSAGIIPQWFSKRSSLANGICAAGAGAGGWAYSLVSSSLLERSGPQLAYRILAICQFTINLICIILIRDRNHVQRPNQSALDYRLLKRLEIWLVLGWGFLSELGYTVLLFSLPNYARSIGLTAKEGAIVGALLNLGLMIGRPLVGHSSDLLGRINMATLTTGFCGSICFFIWIFAKNFPVLCLFAILAGMVCGTFWSTIAPVGVDVAGLKELPSTLSIVLVLMVFPTTCESTAFPSSPGLVIRWTDLKGSSVLELMQRRRLTSISIVAESIALALRRSTGDIYLDAQIFTGFMFIGASLCTLFLRSWKIGQIEKEIVAKRERDRRETQAGPFLPDPGVRLPPNSLMLRRLFRLQKV